MKEDLTPNGQTHHRIYRPSGTSLRFNASSMDLPLGDQYWVMRGSCRCGQDLSVEDLFRYFAVGGDNRLADGTVLKKGQVYLIKLDCKVDFSGTRIQGKATGRSSIGRLDVLVRTLVEHGKEFDRVDEEARGDLYVEVAPISFDLLVRPGTCLSQLRLFRGTESLFTLTMDELQYEDPFPVVDANSAPLIQDCAGRGTTFPFSLDLTVDEGTQCSGFVAKEEPPEAVDPDRRDSYDPHEFWDPVILEKDALFLEPNRLYILRSQERLRLPGHLAVECQAYTETLGEWRVEYAGFAHPWFGASRGSGTPIIFELRGHNIPTIVRNGLQLGKVSFRRMSTLADEPAEQQYERQELKLSSCFKAWQA